MKLPKKLPKLRKVSLKSMLANIAIAVAVFLFVAMLVSVVLLNIFM